MKEPKVLLCAEVVRQRVPSGQQVTWVPELADVAISNNCNNNNNNASMVDRTY